MLNKGTGFIASRIKTEENKGIPVVLFNSLSWDRVDPVEVALTFEMGSARSLEIVNAKGEALDAQLKNVSKHQDGSIKEAKIVFIADVPSIGYNTYYIEPQEKVKNGNPVQVKSNQSFYENEFYKIEFAPGGIEGIFDRELKRNLLNTSSFKGGEVFTLQSVGNGAGEFGDVQQPTLTDFDKVSLRRQDWSLIESGPVYSTYRIRQKIKHAIVEQDVIIYHALKRVNFETRLLNWSGKMYREFRTAFPINMENAEISYEVPFGKVKVGQDEIKTAGERYVPLCKDVHPRSVLDWITTKDEDMQIVLSSSVAAFDWIDPLEENGSPLIQHILLASRKSCHWEGNEYSQAGNHYYSYILTSNGINDHTGTRVAKQHNEPIKVILNPEKSVIANLPEQLSFFNITNENVIITTVKKAEDNDMLIVRMYDTDGVNNSVKLNSWLAPRKYYATNIIEEYPEEINDIIVPPYSIETYMVELSE